MREDALALADQGDGVAERGELFWQRRPDERIKGDFVRSRHAGRPAAVLADEGGDVVEPLLPLIDLRTARRDQERGEQFLASGSFGVPVDEGRHGIDIGPQRRRDARRVAIRASLRPR
jgi:hypothetical protein